MKFKFLSIFILFVGIQTVLAQKEVPTIWETTVSKSEVKAGETIDLIFKARIIDGWYLYSSDFDPDLGPVVASFSFTENDSYRLEGDIKPVGSLSKEDNLIWMGTYTYFKNKAEFRQTVKILKDNPEIRVKLYGQACNDESGKCVPVIQQFTFDQIKVIADSGKNGQKKHTDTPLKNDEGKPKSSAGKNTTGMSTPNAQPENTSGRPASNLEELKAQKKELVKTNQQGEDLVTKELSDFVKKYGTN